MFEIATVVGEPELEILEAKDCRDESKLTVLEGVFSSGEDSYIFKLKSDGTGAIFYSDNLPDSEEFTHEINVETLVGEVEGAIRAEISL